MIRVIGCESCQSPYATGVSQLTVRVSEIVPIGRATAESPAALARKLAVSDAGPRGYRKDRPTPRRMSRSLRVSLDIEINRTHAFTLRIPQV